MTSKWLCRHCNSSGSSKRHNILRGARFGPYNLYNCIQTLHPLRHRKLVLVEEDPFGSTRSRWKQVVICLPHFEMVWVLVQVVLCHLVGRGIVSYPDRHQDCLCHNSQFQCIGLVTGHSSRRLVLVCRAHQLADNLLLRAIKLSYRDCTNCKYFR